MAEIVLNTIDEVLTAIDEEKQLDPGLVSPGEKKRFVQDALDDLGDLGVFEKVVESTVATSTVDLATLGGSDTGYDSVIEVYWNGRVIHPVSPRQVDRTVEGSQPTGYWLMGSSLYLYPRLAAGASGTLSVEMVFRPLTVPDLPREWRRLLVLYGVYRSHKKNGSTFSSREYEREYETRKVALFNKAIQAKNQRRSSNDREDSFSGDDTLTNIIKGLG